MDAHQKRTENAPSGSRRLRPLGTLETESDRHPEQLGGRDGHRWVMQASAPCLPECSLLTLELPVFRQEHPVPGSPPAAGTEASKGCALGLSGESQGGRHAP